MESAARAVEAIAEQMVSGYPDWNNGDGGGGAIKISLDGSIKHSHFENILKEVYSHKDYPATVPAGTGERVVAHVSEDDHGHGEDESSLPRA